MPAHIYRSITVSQGSRETKQPTQEQETDSHMVLLCSWPTGTNAQVTWSINNLTLILLWQATNQISLELERQISREGRISMKPNKKASHCTIEPGLDNLGVSRVALYTKNSLIVQRRKYLEGGNVCTLWLQIGLPNRHVRILTGQNNSRSSNVASQLERWTKMLEEWERALEEQRETFCMIS